MQSSNTCISSRLCLGSHLTSAGSGELLAEFLKLSQSGYHPQDQSHPEASDSRVGCLAELGWSILYAWDSVHCLQVTGVEFAGYTKNPRPP